MTRDETKKIIAIIVTAFPNYNPKDLSMTVDVWNEMLKDYSYKDVAIALKTYIATNTSGFAPSIGQLIEKMNVVNEMNELSEMEAWAIVSKAIRDSIYHSKERFEEFPDDIKKAVGSHENLKAWGMDENYNENVTQSHFLRCYRSVLERKKEVAKLPSEVRQLIGIASAGMGGMNVNITPRLDGAMSVLRE